MELDHAALLRPFLAKHVRPRYDAMQPGSARRAELLNKLCHRHEEVLDWRYARTAASADLPKELRGFGAANICYCLCDQVALDGREAPLDDALAALVGSGLPVLLVCRPGMLAYFEPEYESGPGQSFILQLPGVQRGASRDRDGR